MPVHFVYIDTRHTRSNFTKGNTMRTGLIIVGILLVAAGIWVVAGHASYQDTDTLLQVGSAKITATHDKGVPQWIGIAGIVVGALLAIGGFMQKR
jgi:hypothetical protein